MNKKLTSPRIIRQSLMEKVVSIIRNGVIEGNFKPGERLPEVWLSKQLGVSRAPIREAFRILENEGMIETVVGKGVRVRELTAKDIESIYEVRSTLESLAVKLASPNLRESDISHLENILSQMDLCVKQGDSNSYRRLNAEFHDLFYQRSGNEWLCSIYNDLMNHITRLRTVAHSISEWLNQSYRYHLQILEAIKENRVAEVEQVAKQHVKDGGKFVLEHLVEKDSIAVAPNDVEISSSSPRVSSGVSRKSTVADLCKRMTDITQDFQGNSLEGVVVRVPIPGGYERGVISIHPKMRCFKRFEVHELVVINERGATLGVKVHNISGLAYIEFSTGGVIVEGDTVTLGNHVLGEIAGFDETHVPDHIHIVLRQLNAIAGVEVRINPRDKVFFTQNEERE